MANWIDPSSKSRVELDRMIVRYQAQGLTSDLQYLAYVEEYGRRTAPGLSPDASIAAIRESAQLGRFISYGDVAKASGKDWQKVRRLIPAHLDQILWLAHQRGWPLITAIVVNKQHVATGDMEPTSLAGFIEGARRLKFIVTDEVAILKEQQRTTFDWAKA
ncbi:MAG: hypothetical protein ACRCWO_13960 [Bosea sp. (in: a-proteobacteria)]